MNFIPEEMIYEIVIHLNGYNMCALELTNTSLLRIITNWETWNRMANISTYKTYLPENILRKYYTKIKLEQIPTENILDIKTIYAQHYFTAKWALRELRKELLSPYSNILMKRLIDHGLEPTNNIHNEIYDVPAFNRRKVIFDWYNLMSNFCHIFLVNEKTIHNIKNILGILHNIHLAVEKVIKCYLVLEWLSTMNTKNEQEFGNNFREYKRICRRFSYLYKILSRCDEVLVII